MPPTPPSSSNLVVQFTEGTIIDFDDTVTYICKEGHYFHRNFDQNKYELTCLRDGNFAEFDPLEFCVHPRGITGFIKEIKYEMKIYDELQSQKPDCQNSPKKLCSPFQIKR